MFLSSLTHHYGATLKEAKESLELSKQTKVTVRIENAELRRNFVKELQSLGCKIE